MAKSKKPAKKVTKKPTKTLAKKTKKPLAKAKKVAARKAAPKKGLTTSKVKASAKSKKSSKKPLPAKSTRSAKSSAVSGKTNVAWDKLITPLDDRVFVQVLGESDRTPGGLYIPDTATSTERNKRGQVVVVGRGHLNKKGHLRPLDVKVGDSVMFPAYAGSNLSLEGQDLVVLRESEILGIES